MSRPDPVALDPARYPYCCSVAPRFGDLDVNMHLNNVALVGIFEDARVRFHHASGYHTTLAGVTAMIVSLGIEFVGQAFYPAALDVHAGITRLGKTSFALQQLMIQEGRAVAQARAVMVTVAQGRPVAISDDFRQGAVRWMLRA